MDTVDWHEQWAQFAEGFHEGKAHISLSRFGTNHTLYLLPGPGFGDLSHPTTHLMLEMMTGSLHHQTALDIGCGSGILSLAALFMGAPFAYGIDIDESALLHAQQNALLNQLESRAHFARTLPKQAHGIVLFNMILLEQKTVLQEIPHLPHLAQTWICSGILDKQRNEALSFYRSLKLELVEEKKRGEWLSFKLSGFS